METIAADYVFVDDVVAVPSTDPSTTEAKEQKAVTERRIREWLAPSDYFSSSSEYQKHRIAHTPGTGSWLADTIEYRQWYSGDDSGTLWLKGVPGSGKSVLTADILRQLLAKDGSKTPVLFFFFRHIISTNRTPSALLRDWLAQALPYSAMLRIRLETYIDDKRQLDTLSYDELWTTLLSSLKYVGKVYCVVDALDEMDGGNEAFIECLVALGKLNPKSVKVLLTSRPVPRIENILRESSVLQVRLDQHKLDKDIATYVDFRFNDDLLLPLGESMVAGTFRDLLTATLCRNGKGLFIYAKLMSDNVAAALQAGCSLLEAEELLHNLPGNLEAMYTQMLKDHASRLHVDLGMQVTVVRWATHAARPLRLIELAGAVHAGLSDSQANLKHVKEIVRASCGPLLEIFEDESVQVIHHSFTEFLTDRDRANHSLPDQLPPFPIIAEQESHRALTLVCLKALIAAGASEPKLPQKRRYSVNDVHFAKIEEKRSKSQPFLNYSEDFWGYHASRCDVEDAELFSLLDQYILPQSIPLDSADETSQTPEDELATEVVGDVGSNGPQSPLNIAAEHGLARYAVHLLNMGFPVDGRQRQRSPIAAAARLGNMEVVQVLAAHKAQLDSDDPSGMKPILYAASANHASVVKFLLEKGVKASSRKTRYQRYHCGNARSNEANNAIEYASDYDHLETILELLPYAEVKDLEIAIRRAARARSTRIVLAILNYSRALANPSCDGVPPLYHAVWNLDLHSIRALLDHGADVSMRMPLNGRDFPPMDEVASSNGNLFHILALVGTNGDRRIGKEGLSRVDEIVDMLITHGVEIDAVDTHGRTALFLAFQAPGAHITNQARQENVIQSLLSHGADASAMDAQGNGILAAMGNPLDFGKETIEMLVKSGASLNVQCTTNGKTPLHLAVQGQRHQYWEQLLALGADPSIRDFDGNTVLHAACMSLGPLKSLIQLVLDSIPDEMTKTLINLLNNDGETCLHKLVSNDKWTRCIEEDVAPLLSIGADLEVKNHKGETVIMHFLQNLPNRTYKGEKAMEDLTKIVQLKPKIDVRDHNGRTLAHAASRAWNIPDLLDFLLTQGVDIHSVDYAGNTVLHEAVTRSARQRDMPKRPFLQSLFDKGLSPLTKNSKGYTPLHILVATPPQSNSPEAVTPVLDLINLLSSETASNCIDVRDSNGATPLHIACASSEYYAWHLLKLGADLTIRSFDGRTPLHVACRARQSNIVGMLLERYGELDTDFVNRRDRQGQSALFDACRSGQVESVDLLLKAGADVDCKDNVGSTLLTACQQFPLEETYWQTLNLRSNADWGVNVTDAARPVPDGKSYEIVPDRCTARIGETVRMLLEAGMDISNIRRSFSDHFWIVARDGKVSCDAVALELERWTDSHSPMDPAELRLNVLKQPLIDITVPQALFAPSKLRVPENKQSALDMFLKMLRCNDEDAILELAQHGLDLTFAGRDSMSALHHLAAHGYSNLLTKIGFQARLFDDLEAIGKLDLGPLRTNHYVFPILQTACKRPMYNLKAIRVLVDDLGVRVDTHRYVHQLRPGRGIVPGITALHHLAEGRHWWHAHAIAFLLDRGADPNVQDERGLTPLHVAVKSSGPDSIPNFGERCVKVLLDAGAKPNLLDADGFSCLQKAGSKTRIFRMLVKAGADASLGQVPAMFSAIHTYNLEVLRILLGEGADCNIRLRQLNQKMSPHYTHHLGLPFEYPLLHAALQWSGVHGQGEMDLDERQDMVALLLAHGADASLRVDDDRTVLHYICEHNGVIQPFLDAPGIDLETRDSSGRTPLLSSCYAKVLEALELGEGGEGERGQCFRRLAHRVSRTVTDNEGQHILHHLLLSGRGESVGRMLFDYADVRALSGKKDNNGFSPIHLSLRLLSMTATRALLDYGADLTEADPYGNTTLHHLARAMITHPSNHFLPELIDQCLAKGVDVNQRNNDGQPPLFAFLTSVASKCSLLNPLTNMLEIVCVRHRDRFGTFENADLFVRDNIGQTALHWVASRKPLKNRDRRFYADASNASNADTVDLFKFLMERGLDPLAVDDRQMTPLDVAYISGQTGILSLFAREK